MKKWTFVSGYILLLLVTWLERERLWTWTEQQASWPVLLLVSFLFALLPVFPYKLVIAAISYTTGPWQGALICWTGSSLAAFAVYAGIRYFFRASGQAYLQRSPALSKVNRVMEGHPFVSVLLARLFPLIPQTVVNVYAGVARFPFHSFALGTCIGKLPGVTAYAFAGGLLATYPLAGVSLAVLYLGISIGIFMLLRKKLYGS